jgi:hypothetical protein
MWETPKLPLIWQEEIVKFDHIVAATSFIKSSVESATKSIPVSVIPQSITTIEDTRLSVRALGLPDDRRYHLYSFSYSSYVSRKNPMQFLNLKKMFCEANLYSKDVFVLASSDLPRQKADDFYHKTFLNEQDLNFAAAADAVDFSKLEKGVQSAPVWRSLWPGRSGRRHGVSVSGLCADP